MKGYKAVRRYGTRFQSGVVDHQFKIYRLNTTTRRSSGCGPLAVFSNKQDALSFIKVENRSIVKPHRRLHLFRCEYQPSKEYDLWRRNAGRLSFAELPLGTRLAETVTLLKKIII